MQSCVHLPTHNINVISFEQIYNESFVPNFLRYLAEYNIAEIKLKNKDIRKLLYHSIIHAICESVLHVKGREKTVIYYNTNHLPKSDLNRYVSEEELIVFVEMLLRKMTKLLPIKIFITSHTFEYFKYLLQKNDARGMELLYNIKSLIERSNYEKYTFKKIRVFAQKYGLAFLSDVYFNAIKSKQLLLK